MGGCGQRERKVRRRGIRIGGDLGNKTDEKGLLEDGRKALKGSKANGKRED